MKAPKAKQLWDVHIMQGRECDTRGSKWVATPHYNKEYQLASWLGKQERLKYGKGYYHVLTKNGNIPN